MIPCVKLGLASNQNPSVANGVDLAPIYQVSGSDEVPMALQSETPASSFSKYSKSSFLQWFLFSFFPLYFFFLFFTEWVTTLRSNSVLVVTRPEALNSRNPQDVRPQLSRPWVMKPRRPSLAKTARGRTAAGTCDVGKEAVDWMQCCPSSQILIL